MLIFLQYPKCGTCRKAKQFLDQNNITYTSKHIVEDVPTEQELQTWISISGLPIQKFFNTSGQVYRQMELAKRLPEMTDQEKIHLLSSNGMLIKRPILTDGKKISVGFKEAEWEEKWT